MNCGDEAVGDGMGGVFVVVAACCHVEESFGGVGGDGWMRAHFDEVDTERWRFRNFLHGWSWG
jgi:hypothetical protein